MSLRTILSWPSLCASRRHGQGHGQAVTTQNKFGRFSIDNAGVSDDPAVSQFAPDTIFENRDLHGPHVPPSPHFVCNKKLQAESQGLLSSSLTFSNFSPWADLTLPSLERHGWRDHVQTEATTDICYDDEEDLNSGSGEALIQAAKLRDLVNTRPAIALEAFNQFLDKQLDRFNENLLMQQLLSSRGDSPKRLAETQLGSDLKDLANALKVGDQFALLKLKSITDNSETEELLMQSFKEAVNNLLFETKLASKRSILQTRLEALAKFVRCGHDESRSSTASTTISLLASSFSLSSASTPPESDPTDPSGDEQLEEDGYLGFWQSCQLVEDQSSAGPNDQDELDALVKSCQLGGHFKLEYCCRRLLGLTTLTG